MRYSLDTDDGKQYFNNRVPFYSLGTDPKKYKGIQMVTVRFYKALSLSKNNPTTTKILFHLTIRLRLSDTYHSST